MSSAWSGLMNNKSVTQLPHYAINKNLPADSYFTSSETAEKCLSILNRVIDTDGHTFIEPSAGEGAFYDLLPEPKIGIELYGRRKEFIKQDYLTWYPTEDQKYVVVGNPPFGVRGAYALAFINRSFLFAEYVAMVLPMSFHSNGKGSNMKRVMNGHLIHSEILEKESFYSPDNDKTIQVNTLFQIWKRGEGECIFPDIDVSDYIDIYTVCSSPDRLCGMDKIGTYDFYVSSSYFGTQLETVHKFEDVKYGSGYGILVKQNKDEIMSLVDKVNWDTYASSATNSCKHIRKYSIEKYLFDNGYGKKREKQQAQASLENFFS